MALSGRLHLETGSEKFKMAAAKTGSTCVSTSIQDSKEIPTAICMFWGQGAQNCYQKGSILEAKSEIQDCAC
jgi:hypothetical protein